ncbi:MAG: hypothetical protein GY851_23925 [bacterium]|nr:hypothetical protein [bacterium]
MHRRRPTQFFQLSPSRACAIVLVLAAASLVTAPAARAQEDAASGGSTPSLKESLLLELESYTCDGPSATIWRRSISEPSAFECTQRLAELDLAPEEWVRVEAKWLEALPSIVDRHEWLPDVLMRLLLSFEGRELGPELLTSLKQTWSDWAEERDYVKKEYRRLPERSESLTTFEFTTHVIMARYWVDWHATVWAGVGDWTGFGESFAGFPFMNTHREESFQYVLSFVRETGSPGASIVLAYFKDRRALPVLKHWLLHAEDAQASEWCGRGPMGLNEYICPTHAGYVLAIEHIANAPLNEAIILTQEEVDLLLKRLDAFPADEDDDRLRTKRRIAASLLHDFAPELLSDEVCHLFRSRSPRYRSIWPYVLTKTLPEGLATEQIEALLGPSDAAYPVDQFGPRHSNSNEKFSAQAALIGCDTVMEWDFAEPGPELQGFIEPHGGHRPQSLIVLVGQDRMIMPISDWCYYSIGYRIRRVAENCPSILQRLAWCIKSGNPPQQADALALVKKIVPDPSAHASTNWYPRKGNRSTMHRKRLCDLFIPILKTTEFEPETAYAAADLLKKLKELGAKTR